MPENSGGFFWLTRYNEATAACSLLYCICNIGYLLSPYPIITGSVCATVPDPEYICTWCWKLKVKGLDIYIPPLTPNDQQRFTIRSGVLTGNDIRWCSASSGNPLPEWPHSLQL